MSSYRCLNKLCGRLLVGKQFKNVGVLSIDNEILRKSAAFNNICSSTQCVHSFMYSSTSSSVSCNEKRKCDVKRTYSLTNRFKSINNHSHIFMNPLSGVNRGNVLLFTNLNTCRYLTVDSNINNVSELRLGNSNDLNGTSVKVTSYDDSGSHVQSSSLDLSNENDNFTSYSDEGFSQLPTSSFEGGELLQEPSFSSIGLGGWTPSGLVQSGMEYLHVTCGLPWWGCIVCGTLIIRMAVLPLVIRFQKQMIVMNNALPEMQMLQMKLMNARQAGNLVEASHYTNEMMRLVQSRKINPLKSMALPLIQMPFFLSFFFGLRGMAELPVESLRQGGLWWFTDLTVTDPTYILPVATCLTVLITVELGIDTGVSPNQMQLQAMKYFMRVMPFLMFPIIINFPGVLLVYWLSTNVISLVQMKVLRIPAVRDGLGFETPIKPNPDLAAQFQQMASQHNNQGFKQGFKESMTNLKMSQEMLERQTIELEERLRKMRSELNKRKEEENK